MGGFNWTAYYCGHGAMNYIELFNRNEVLTFKIVIDAGSNDDRKAASKNFSRLCARLWEENTDAKIILCITHYDEDHYNFLSQIYQDIIDHPNRISNIYCGSLSGDAKDWIDPRSFIAMLSKHPNICKKVIVPNQINQILSIISVDQVEFYMLWNNLCPETDNNLNDNTAAFAIKNTEKHVAVVFPGDMTGNTLNRLNELSSLKGKVSQLLGDCQVIMSVPHHGSIDTLRFGNFIKEDDMAPLGEALDELGMNSGIYFISSGINDKFHHPNILTAKAFQDASKRFPESRPGFCPVYDGSTRFFISIENTGLYGSCYVSSISLPPVAQSYMVESMSSTEAAYYIETSTGSQTESKTKESSETEVWLPAPELLPQEVLPEQEPDPSVGDEIVSFRKLFGSMGTMLWYDEGILKFDASPAEDLCLSDYHWNEGFFSGILDTSRSKFSQYSFLDGIHMKGSFKDGILTAGGSVTVSPPDFSPLPLTLEEASFAIRTEEDLFQGEKRLLARAELVWKAELGKRERYHISLECPLLKEPEFTITFGGTEGIPVMDCAATLPDLLGLPLDLLEFLPFSFIFSPAIRLYSIKMIMNGEKNSIRVLSVCFGYEKKAAAEAAEAAFSVTGIKFLIHCYLKNGTPNRFSGSMQASFFVFGQKLELYTSYPQYFIELSSPLGQEIPISKAAQAYGLTLPGWLQKASIHSVYFGGALDFESYRFLLEMESLFTFQLSKTVSVRLSQLAVEVSRLAGERSERLRAGITLETEKTLIAAFFAEGIFMSSGIAFSGSLSTPDTALADFYEAVSGSALPKAFPQVQILYMTMEAEYGERFEMKRYAAGVLVDLSDQRVFGMEIHMEAQLEGSSDTLTIKGNFIFGNYFTVYAQLSLQNHGADWKFGLLFAKTILEISYETAPRPCLKGTITTELKLGAAVNYLVGLLNPEDSYAPPAEWKLLDSISLKGVELVYYYDTDEVMLAVTPQLTLPFAKVDRLCIVMGKNGVDFQMSGKFLDEEYTADNPLIWDVHNPPQPTGNLLHVNYLVFGDGIAVDLGPVLDIGDALKTLEDKIPVDGEPKGLILNRNAGFLAGLDCLIADAVQLKLLYDDWPPFYGAQFYLYGDKAGVLKGLDVQAAYTRLNGGAGVYSVRAAPPESLRSIRLGSITVGIGEISAQVYTNGNFLLDLGYPAERNFTRSFSFSYGIFEGKGGVYVKKGIVDSQLLPKTDKGYFSPVLSMGIGMHLALSQKVNAGPLAASASLVMQGMFEGVYATYLPNDKGTSDTYYKVFAEVSFDGKLQGSVDFGLIGASVTISVSAKANLTAEAYRPVTADIALCAEASASIKILFCRIRFHFSMHFALNFTFAKGGMAPWDEGYHFIEEIRSDAMPKRLLLSPKAALKTRIAVGITVLYGMEDGHYTSVLTGLVRKEDFAVIISLLGQLAEANGYLCKTDGEELFKRERFFARLDWLYQFLSANLVLEFYAVQEELEGAVMIPLPSCLKVTVKTAYDYGVTDIAERNLQEYFLLADSYAEAMRSYYRDTMFAAPSPRTGRSSFGLSGEPDQVSMQEQIFGDYFELILKALRAEKENSARLGRSMKHGALLKGQLDNIIGLCTRFLLGGRRGPSKELSDAPVLEITGLWKLAGSQIYLPYGADVTDYTYVVEFAGECPDWAAFSGKKEELSWRISRQEAEKQFPALTLPDRFFQSGPAVMPVYEKAPTNAVSLKKVLGVRGNGHAYYHTGRNLRESVIYTTEDQKVITFGVMIRIVLQKCRNTRAIYRIMDSGDIAGAGGLQNEKRTFLRGGTGIGDKEMMAVEKITLLYPSAPGDRNYSAYEGGGLYQLNNRLAGAMEGPDYIPVTKKQEFAERLFTACLEETENYLGFSDEVCPLPDVEEQEIYAAVCLQTEGKYDPSCNFLYTEKTAEEILLISEQMTDRNVLPQGAAGILVKTDDAMLTEKEKLLAGQYRNMAAEVREPAGNKVSHETLTFIGEGVEEGKNTYKLVIPYSRALDGPDADAYSFVSNSREVVLHLFWVDFFGNRMETGRELSFRPKYTDDLIAVHTWPGVDVSFGLWGGRLTITFEYNGHNTGDDEVWRQALLQLSQPDVTVTLKNELLSESVTVEKQRLVTFLQSCIQNPEDGARMTLEFAIRDPGDTAEIISLSTALYLFRKSVFVHEQAPLSAYSARSDLRYGDMEYEKDRSAGADRVKVFVGSRSIKAVLSKEQPVLCLSEFRYYAWLCFPKVTGSFGSGAAAIQLDAFDLQEVFGLFCQDLEYLLSPYVLETVCTAKALEAQVETLYEIRRKAAGAIAKRVKPMFCYKDESTDAGMMSYVEGLLLHTPDIGLEHVLFLCMKGRTKLEGGENRWCYEGSIDHNDDYPVRLQLDSGQAIGYGAIGGKETVDMEGKNLGVEYLYDTKEGEWLAPERGDLEVLQIPLESKDRISLPKPGVPSMPACISEERSPGAYILTLELKPLGGDVLYLLDCKGRNRKQAEENAPVLAMYEYYTQSRSLQDKTSQTDLAKLIGYMQKYVEALQVWQDEVREESPIQKFYFKASENMWERIQLLDSSWRLSLDYSCDGKIWYPMKKEEGGFLFDAACKPSAGERLCLRIVWETGGRDGSYAFSMVREQTLSEGKALPAQNHQFNQWSAAVSFD